jgi:hypothetical protein
LVEKDEEALAFLLGEEASVFPFLRQAGDAFGEFLVDAPLLRRHGNEDALVYPSRQVLEDFLLPAP